MEPHLQPQVQRYGWDAAAGYHGDGWADPLAPARATALRFADLKPGPSVIEVAAGSGLVTVAISEAVGPDDRVFATDISEEMVALLDGLGLIIAETACMDAGALTVEEASFVAAIGVLGPMYAPDPGAIVVQMAHAVRPGARVMATVWDERSNCGWAEIFPIADSVGQSEDCPKFFALTPPKICVLISSARGCRRSKSCVRPRCCAGPMHGASCVHP